jgi:hypothetical protein
MHHHPDKPGGNKARFEVLNYAYRRANHRCCHRSQAFAGRWLELAVFCRYDPENFEFIDDLE